MLFIFQDLQFNIIILSLMIQKKKNLSVDTARKPKAEKHCSYIRFLHKK